MADPIQAGANAPDFTLPCVARRYGVYRAKEGLTERALFVIDAQGKVAWSYVSPIGVNPGADGILDALEKLGAPS